MALVCILTIELTIALWAFDFFVLACPNIIDSIAPATLRNAPLLIRITNKVARMDNTMLLIRISAYNNIIVLPSVDMTVKILDLSGLSTTLTCGHAFPQGMASLDNIP